jgi:hypothetical protein
MQVEPLNYCAHAIEDMKKLERALRPIAPQSAQTVSRLADMLRRSVKFILPNCCDLIDPEEMKQSHLDLLRLPFPVVAFEAPWQREAGPDQIGEYEQLPATKRIALCWEASAEQEAMPGLNDILQRFPEGGVFVVPIYWGPSFDSWNIAIGGLFLPYNNEMVTVSDTDQVLPASRIAHEAMAEIGRNVSKQFSAEPFWLLREHFEQAVAQYGSVDKAYAQIMLDTHDETMVLIQVCSVLNCANVGTADIAAPEALNKKRRAKGKQPFFSYKVLELSDERRAYGAGQGGGSHGAPRMHLRRGHLRRLPEKVVWVRPSMVNANSEHGIVAKDYAVKSARVSGS